MTPDHDSTPAHRKAKVVEASFKYPVGIVQAFSNAGEATLQVQALLDDFAVSMAEAVSLLPDAKIGLNDHLKPPYIEPKGHAPATQAVRRLIPVSGTVDPLSKDLPFVHWEASVTGAVYAVYGGGLVGYTRRKLKEITTTQLIAMAKDGRFLELK